MCALKWTDVWFFGLCFSVLFSIVVHGIESDCPVALIQPRARISKEDNFLCLFPKKTLGGLKYGKDNGVYVVCASVVGLWRVVSSGTLLVISVIGR